MPGEVTKPLPGAPRLPKRTAAAITGALAALPQGWRPRTRHLNEDGGPLYANRLALESSPYLLQHAHNPVDWWPWGDEAFAQARERGVLVLLSVGYSTCHWCHVMEEESFEHLGIAELINRRFVAVKVDREERPDVDALYMAAAQAVGGRGGWPLTVALTADREPAWVGTYLPPEDGQRGAAVGLRTVLEKLSEAHGQGRLAERAKEISGLVKRHLEPLPAGRWPGMRALLEAGRALGGRFDRVYGGAAGAPKFPGSMPTGLLLRLWTRFGDGEAKGMATLSLDQMAAGGIHDHLGGGFHRYSVDERWLVPHFEKMLYDNALLARDYLDGWQATGKGRFAEVVRSTLGWMAKEMTSAEGAFFSATDADSLGEEGKLEEGPFFTWTPGEVREALGEGAEAALLRWGVVEEGHMDGRSVLHESMEEDELGLRLGQQPEEVLLALERAREGLLAARAARPAPHRDDKLLASWNGLAIGAFARAGLVLGEETYTEVARRAAEFVLGEMMVEGRLMHSWCQGVRGKVGFLEDGAAMAWGVLGLFEATGEVRWLRDAVALMEGVEEDYLDSKNGGYFATVEETGLLAREKPFVDGATPSPNGMAALVQARLAVLTGKDLWRERALATVRAFSTVLARVPAVAPWLLAAVDALVGDAHQLVIVSPRRLAAADSLLHPWRTRHLPNSVVVPVLALEAGKELSAAVPMAAKRPEVGGEPTAYVCLGTTCSLPVTDARELGALLDGKEGPAKGA